MRIEKVVINSSPLIVLFKTGQSDLLPLLFERIIRSVKRRIDRFRDAGLYLSESVIQLLLFEAGE